MGDEYKGNANNYPKKFTLADASAPPDAATFNVGLEALGDRTEHLRTRMALTELTLVDFHFAGADVEQIWVPPPGVYSVWVFVLGGGGGGGAGASDAFSTFQGGGGGGGGALGHWVLVRVVPGAPCSIVVGGAGEGGEGEVSPGVASPGGDGGDSRFIDRIGFGASGGAGGFASTSTIRFSLGGGPAKAFRSYGTAAAPTLGPCDGGFSSPGNSAVLTPSGRSPGGQHAPTQVAPGRSLGGQIGNDHVARVGGVGGGGGGSSYFGAGGDGGKGGNANNSGVGAPGLDGAHAAVLGAGGGGGGGGGEGSVSHGAAGKGGSGGDGLVRIALPKIGLEVP